MVQHFNAYFADKYGIEGAIIIECIYGWIRRNVCNDEVFKEERVWCYMSAKGFNRYITYMNPLKIHRELRKLEGEVLLVGNFNLKPTNQTLWYTFTDKFLVELKEHDYDISDFSKVKNPFFKNEKSNNKIINNPIIEDNKKESKSLSNDKQKGWKTDSEFMKFWNLYDYKKGADTAYRAWKKLSKQEKQDAVKAIPLYFEDCREHSRNKRYPATYLNAHTWEDDFTCTGLVEEKEEKEESSASDWDAQKRWLEKNTPNIAGRMTKEMLRRFKELCMCDSYLLADTLREFDKIYDGGDMMKEFEELCKKR